VTESRIPPQATEIEESVLGSMLIDIDTVDIVTGTLHEEDFYNPRNRSIFLAIRRLYSENKSIDALSVEQFIKDNDEPVDPSYVSELTRYASIGAVEDHCQIIKEKSIKRRIILDCSEIVNDSYGERDAYSIIDKLNGIADSVDSGSKRTHSLTPSQIIEREKDAPVQEKLFTGDYKLDNGIFADAGTRKGQVQLIIADSGHGKTSVAMWEAEMLLRRGYKGAWFQLEDYDKSTADHFDRNTHNEKDNIWVCDSLYDIEDIKREARALKREHGIDFIVFDYVQNIEYTKGKRYDEVEYISKQVTRMAKDLNVLVIPLSQVTLNYGSTHGWSLEPGKGHVRWSQQLKQDAHCIISVFRPSEITNLVVNESQVKDWKDNLHPINSVWIKQAKIRYGKKELRRYHLIHTDKGLKPYEVSRSEYPQNEKPIF